MSTKENVLLINFSYNCIIFLEFIGESLRNYTNLRMKNTKLQNKEVVEQFKKNIKNQ